jgi:hypothetical protein
MGLSIHYSGNIKEEKLIAPMVAELEDICKSMGWEYHVWQQKEFTPVNNDIDYTPEYFNGISFNVKGCEMISLCFLPNKRMSSLINLMAKDVYDDVEWIYSVSVKTQFAGPDAHIAIIKLLRYINNKYLDNFKMDDEGYYWETNDEQKLLSQFKIYNFILDEFANGLEGLQAVPGETPLSLAERIEKIFAEIHKKLNP